jgi:hypothetical protein
VAGRLRVDRTDDVLGEPGGNCLRKGSWTKYRGNRRRVHSLRSRRDVESRYALFGSAGAEAWRASIALTRGRIADKRLNLSAAKYFPPSSPRAASPRSGAEETGTVLQLCGCGLTSAPPRHPRLASVPVSAKETRTTTRPNSPTSYSRPIWAPAMLSRNAARLCVFYQ